MRISLRNSEGNFRGGEAVLSLESSGESSETFVGSSTDPLLPSVIPKDDSGQVASSCRASQGKVESFLFTHFHPAFHS